MAERNQEFVRKQHTRQYEGGEIGSLHREADSLANQGQWVAAAGAYARLVSKVPIYEAYTNLGACNLRVGRYDEAIVAFDAAFSLEPQHPHEYMNFNNRGYAYYKKREFDLAERDYNTALLQNHSYADAHYNLAELLSDTGAQSRAIESYRDFVKFANPSQFSHHRTLLEEAHKKIARLEGRGPGQIPPNIPPELADAANVLFGASGVPGQLRGVANVAGSPRNQKVSKLQMGVVAAVVVVLVLLAMFFIVR